MKMLTEFSALALRKAAAARAAAGGSNAGAPAAELDEAMDASDRAADAADASPAADAAPGEDAPGEVTPDGAGDAASDAASEAAPATDTPVEQKPDPIVDAIASALAVQPDRAARMIEALDIIGNRMDDVARMPFLRRVVNRYMSNEISRVCGQKVPDTQCGYRMLHRKIIPDMLGGGHRFDYETEALIIASRKGYRIDSVPISTVYTDQVSKIHPMRDSLRFFKMMRRYRASNI